MRVMNPINADKTALERAFEIAGSGVTESIEDIRRQLLHEGYNHYQVTGSCLLRQLTAVSKKARDATHGDTQARHSEMRLKGAFRH